jgi:5-methylcytosine-specific restriction endonuclease McrA
MPYKDPEEQRAYAREWMRRNPEKAREATRRWRLAHPERHNEKNRRYYSRNREVRLAHTTTYHREHPEVGRARSENYRARNRAALGSFTAAEWLALVAQYGGRCAYRGEAGSLEADHRIPLDRGGTNFIENILPACRRCNAEKRTMTEAEFRARLAGEQPPDLQSP